MDTGDDEPMNGRNLASQINWALSPYHPLFDLMPGFK